MFASRCLRTQRTGRSKRLRRQLLDAIDRRLLEELRRTAGSRWPSSAAASASRRPPSPSACSGSSASGVITGYRAEIDPRALGFPIAADRPRPPRAPAAAADPRDRARDARGRRVLPHHRRGLLLHEAPPALDRRPRGDPRPLLAYGQTTTSIIHSAPVANRPLPLATSPCPGSGWVVPSTHGRAGRRGPEAVAPLRAVGGHDRAGGAGR